MKEAKESLDETLRILNEAKARLREVEEGITALQAKYDECVAKKEELKDKCDLCSARLTRAEKVWLVCKLHAARAISTLYTVMTKSVYMYCLQLCN